MNNSDFLLPPRSRFPKHLLGLAVLMCGSSVLAHADTYAPWLRQIGISSSIESAAKWGKGQTLGVVDTGINATNPQFAAGQVSQTLSSCAATSFKCSNGFADDNSHGTAVASIAAGNSTLRFGAISGGYTTVAGNFIGVAPSANIVAEKVLNKAGSGYSTDVANGIRKATDAGAGVINVSITYSNDKATVAAINYAASKGAFIVWAGGNDAKNLMNNATTSGLTPAAIQHLIFAGSVNSSNAASSFTNKPGNGNLRSTTNKDSAYSTRWIMAPGEAILAPYATAGSGAYGFWSGTSMAAPVVSGSLMLLQNTWPILKTYGTSVDLLLATATDLGSKGNDTTYGAGLVNLQKAFQPYGVLSVLTPNWQFIPVNSLTGSLISSGALGKLSAVQSKLSNFTAFDSYIRNFTVNLSGLIKSPTAKAGVNPLPTSNYSAPAVMRYEGGELALSLQTTNDSRQPFAIPGIRADLDAQQVTGFSLFTSNTGAVSGFGYGVSSAYPFAKALFNNNEIAMQMTDFDAIGASSLAQRGYQFAYGFQVAPEVRFAATYSDTPPTTEAQPDAPKIQQMKLGLGYQISKNLNAGFSLSTLDERSSLLGASYTENSALALGQNTTEVLGLSLGYQLNENNSVLFNSEFGYTRGAKASDTSLFVETSALQSQSFGMTFLHQNLHSDNDALMISVMQPLRVTAGRAALMSVSVDEQGYPVYGKTWSSLAPDAREIDVSLTYRIPLSIYNSLAVKTQYQHDALNISGNSNTQYGLEWNLRF
jgi:hypothetical protein